MNLSRLSRLMRRFSNLSEVGKGGSLMKIKPDLFRQNNSRISENLLGLEYPECPINGVCAFVTFDYEPVPSTYCKFFKEPSGGNREPDCLYEGSNES